MLQLTENQAVAILIFGTAFMLIMCLVVIGMVIFMNGKRREWDEELQALRAKLKKEMPVNDVLHISNGRTITRRKTT